MDQKTQEPQAPPPVYPNMSDPAYANQQYPPMQQGIAPSQFGQMPPRAPAQRKSAKNIYSILSKDSLKKE